MLDEGSRSLLSLGWHLHPQTPGDLRFGKGSGGGAAAWHRFTSGKFRWGGANCHRLFLSYDHPQKVGQSPTTWDT